MHDRMTAGRVHVAELECRSCGARGYSAVAPRRPDLVRACACGGEREVVGYIEDRRSGDVPVDDDRRTPSRG